jgi:DNA polymerase-1
MVAETTGLPYKSAKILNLALIYGRGGNSTAKELNCSVDEAKAFIKQYHEKLPFVRQLDAVLLGDVTRDNCITTILGRKARFTLFEPADWELSRGVTAVPHWKAIKMWPGKKLRLAGLHKKLNREIQGSAADQLKKAMKDIYDAGLGKHLLWPIHDELCGSVDDEKLAKRISDFMRDAIPLKVPMVVTVKMGPNWGELTEVEL